MPSRSRLRRRTPRAAGQRRTCTVKRHDTAFRATGGGRKADAAIGRCRHGRPQAARARRHQHHAGRSGYGLYGGRGLTPGLRRTPFVRPAAQGKRACDEAARAQEETVEANGRPHDVETVGPIPIFVKSTSRIPSTARIRDAGRRSSRPSGMGPARWPGDGLTAAPPSGLVCRPDTSVSDREPP